MESAVDQHFVMSELHHDRIVADVKHQSDTNIYRTLVNINIYPQKSENQPNFDIFRISANINQILTNIDHQEILHTDRYRNVSKHQSDSIQGLCRTRKLRQCTN